MKTFRLPSCGAGPIFCRAWLPKGTPRATVQLVHGIAEHGGRYAEFARFLVKQGFYVVCHDHMGHGHSGGAGQVQGHFYGGWLAVVDDVEMVRRHTIEKFPDLPHILFAHSMGSFLARTMLFRYSGRGLAGVILSGTGWTPGPVIRMGQSVCRKEILRHTELGHSPLMQKLMFDAFNLKFKPTRTSYDWVCTDAAVVDAYVDDPYCGIPPSLGLVYALLKGLEINQKMSNLRLMHKDLPILFLSGEQDAVGDMGRGVKRCAARFRMAGMERVVINLYPNFRHEMLNEPCKMVVFEDILGWISRII